MGRNEDALKEALEAVRLSPNNISAREKSRRELLTLGRIDEAEQAEREYQKINPDRITRLLELYLLFFRRRDQATMEREAELGQRKSLRRG